MHRLLPAQTPTGWWSPLLSPRWVRLWRPLRRLVQRRQEHIHQVELHGIEHLQEVVRQGAAVLITPNHATYSDPFLLCEAADRVGVPFYFMTAWQVFGGAWPLRRLVLRQHGCFSVDRDGADLRAFRLAVEILQDRPQPLVIFPEGEIYHTNDRIMPFREGAAAIALAAARRAKRPVVCVPCALKYYHLADPTPALKRLADRLEQALYWRPRPDLSLEQRIYRLAEGALALKELEYLGRTCSGPLPERIALLRDSVLARLELSYGLDPAGASVPERVKQLRHQALKKLDALPEGDPGRQQLVQDLDDVFFAVQLFCYPGNYVAQRPTIERIAETFDKFEEDILGVRLATLRGPRGAIVAFGPPVPVAAEGNKKAAAAALTDVLEERVQALLDTTTVPVSRRFAEAFDNR